MGVQSLSRRQRSVAVTALLGVLFTIGAVAVWMWPQKRAVYRPGQHVEGLTAELERHTPEGYPDVTFVDVTRRAGIDFRHFAGKRTNQLPEDMGSGAAWVDYNRDGWLDLFAINMTGSLGTDPASSPAHSRLYRNDGDGTFTDVSEAAGVAFRGWGMGVAVGDANNDGWPDLFLSAYGENVLFVNNGDGTFTDRTAAAGLGGRTGFWAGADWGDYNKDGWLDLYVTGYVQYDPDMGRQSTSQYETAAPASLNPSTFPPARNLLYRNNGAPGAGVGRVPTFTEGAEQAGVSDAAGRGLAAVWCDFTGDGWPDLYVANDVSDNVLFENRGDGTFRDISHPAHVADYRGAMGLAVGDWDGDVDLDLFVTHWLAQENALYVNWGVQKTPSGERVVQFTDEADRYGLGQVALDYVGWGTSFFDYDNDGRLDLFVVNGSTLPQVDRRAQLVAMPDLLFWNRGPTAGFFDASAVSGKNVFRTADGAPLTRQYVGRGAAFGDYDNDGDVDIFVVNHDGPGQLLRNEGGHRKHWLKVRLEGRRSNRSALGTRLRVVTGDEVQIRVVGAQGSYLSQNSLVQHFGLGAYTHVDTLTATWPGGGVQTLVNLSVNQTLRVVEENRLQ